MKSDPNTRVLARQRLLLLPSQLAWRSVPGAGESTLKKVKAPWRKGSAPAAFTPPASGAAGACTAMVEMLASWSSTSQARPSGVAATQLQLSRRRIAAAGGVASQTTPPTEGVHCINTKAPSLAQHQLCLAIGLGGNAAALVAQGFGEGNAAACGSGAQNTQKGG